MKINSQDQEEEQYQDKEYTEYKLDSKLINAQGNKTQNQNEEQELINEQDHDYKLTNKEHIKINEKYYEYIKDYLERYLFNIRFDNELVTDIYHYNKFKSEWYKTTTKINFLKQIDIFEYDSSWQEIIYYGNKNNLILVNNVQKYKVDNTDFKLNKVTFFTIDTNSLKAKIDSLDNNNDNTIFQKQYLMWVYKYIIIINKLKKNSILEKYLQKGNLFIDEFIRIFELFSKHDAKVKEIVDGHQSAIKERLLALQQSMLPNNEYTGERSPEMKYESDSEYVSESDSESDSESVSVSNSGGSSPISLTIKKKNINDTTINDNLEDLVLQELKIITDNGSIDSYLTFLRNKLCLELEALITNDIENPDKILGMLKSISQNDIDNFVKHFTDFKFLGFKNKAKDEPTTTIWTLRNKIIFVILLIIIITPIIVYFIKKRKAKKSKEKKNKKIKK